MLRRLRSIKQTCTDLLQSENNSKKSGRLTRDHCDCNSDDPEGDGEENSIANVHLARTDWSPPSRLEDNCTSLPSELLSSASATTGNNHRQSETDVTCHTTIQKPVSLPSTIQKTLIATQPSTRNPIQSQSSCVAIPSKANRTPGVTIHPSRTALVESELEASLSPVQPRAVLLPAVASLNSNDIGVAMPRKIWVKRPGASATRVEVHEDDLVDNVRDVILHKYSNSLGKSIDSPDITLKITSREQANKNIASERILSPEESIARTLDAYYPGGQTIEEALIIEVPQRRTPKPSPRPGNHLAAYYTPEDFRPGEAARDYFPPMPLHSPRLAHVQHVNLQNGSLPVHSMSVLTTGQIPALPSPGGHAARRHARPKYGRQHTSSPTIMHNSQPNGLETKAQLNGIPTPAPALPTPPAQSDHKTNVTPPNRTTSPHPNRLKKKKTGLSTRDPPAEPVLPSKPASAALLDGRVPPINVLIVEDNVINLRLLEQFMRRLKVRWKTAMNGKEAVSVWREGGFHLVLMDIQLPVMNGLEATKEIRRLESVNGIGLSVFGDSQSNGETNGVKSSNEEIMEEDKLEDRSLFKSPVIIVALTASSLQSDRHEALAVGCNDFLTKPVNFGWMERKVTEWGCMQALIDFDGWRKWKEIEAKKDNMDPEQKKKEEKEEKAKARAALKAALSRPPPNASTAAKKTDSTDSKREETDNKSNPTSTSIVASPTTIDNPGASTPGPTNSSGRRNYRGSRGGGSISNLPATAEVDEKS